MNEHKKELSFKNILLNDSDHKDEVTGFRSQNIREKLAQTYFGNSTQTVKPDSLRPDHPALVKKPRKHLYNKRDIFPFVMLIAFSIFILFTLWRYTGKNQTLEPKPIELSKPIPQSNGFFSLALELLLVDDFNQISSVNKLGGYFGTFSQTPEEPNQFCYLSFDKDNKIGFNGYALCLNYSLQSPHSISNGFWMSLANLDATKYSGLDFFIKGGDGKKYPTSLKLQLKNATQSGTYILNSIDNKWQRVYIPLKNFEGLKDFDHLLKLLIIFENKEGNPKQGIIYVDNLQFVNR